MSYRALIEKVCLIVIYVGVVISLISPVLVDSSYFFPFISSKVFVFRTVVEVMLLTYLGLQVVSAQYRPRMTVPLLLTFGYVVVAVIASLAGGHFYQGFWGDMERGEGLLLWLHLFAFLIILTGAIRSSVHWSWFFDASVVVALFLSFFGLGQALAWERVLATSGSRVDATFGNPSFFAAYLLFHIAFVAHLFFVRRNWYARVYYLLAGLFFSWMVVATETRGAVLGLAAGIVVACLIVALTYGDKKKVRQWGIGVLAFLVVVGGVLFAARHQPWVQESPKLRRIVSITLRERTAQTRLATWKAGLRGFQEKPIIGWGMESFETVFNKNFPPIIYEDEGSQVWFDHAHNVIVDRLVTTGVVGLIVFLALLLYPAYYFVRFCLRDSQRRTSAIVFIGFTVSYLIQDLFVFETVVVYVLLFFTLAFWSVIFLPTASLPLKVKGSKEGVIATTHNSPNPSYFKRGICWSLLVVYAIVIGPMIWYVNLYPAMINKTASAAMAMDPRTQDFFEIVERFKSALEADTYGRQEYRLQFVEFVDGQLANIGEVVPRVLPVVAYADEEVAKQIKESPDNAKNYQLAMRHYNYTFAVEKAKREERLRKALSYFPDLQRLTPTRPQIYQEAGYTELYWYRDLTLAEKLDEAQPHFEAARGYFEKAVELQPTVVESYLNLIMLYFNSGNDAPVGNVVEQMDERGVAFRQGIHLRKILQLAKASERYRWVGFFAREIALLEPENIEAWIDVALAHAYLGERDEAIKIVQERVKPAGGLYAQEADAFIEEVKSGVYEKK